MNGKKELIVVPGEDSTKIFNPEGTSYCTIERDDDSFEAIVKLASFLGYELNEMCVE